MAHRGPRQVEEVYTIKQAEALTGVSANTIRSWERRHGFPSPERTGSNYRSYSAGDVARIRAVRAARDRGQTVEQAIHAIARSEAGEGEGVLAPQPPPSSLPQHAMPQRLVNALFDSQFETANDLLGAQTLSMAVEDACFQLLLPADRDIERRAAAEAAPRVTAALAREWIFRKLVHAFAESSPDTGHRLAAVIAMADAQTRSLSLCHAITLSRAGYRACWIGDGAGPTDVVHLVSTLNPSVVVLSGSGNLAELSIDSAVDRLESLREDGWNGVIALAVDNYAATARIVLPPDAGLAREAIAREETVRVGLHLVRDE